ncbi:MAG: flippase-like domain-containing protein [Candidatus Aminicenantes bacterium]|nr:flippase-like domain-containing protein [Candidatus Aminicenantes bacterium]
MKKRIIRISSIIGLILLVLIVYKIGPAQIWQHIQKITLQNFFILLFMRLGYWLLRTFNWWIILKGYDNHGSFLHLFAARMSSHAVSHLTPSASIGGEATRMMLLNSPNKKINVASVIVDKTIESFTVIFFTIIGVTIAIARIPMPGKYKIIFISFVCLTSLLLVFIFYKQKKGFFGWIINLLGKMKIRPKFLENNKEKIEETDRYISEFYRKHKNLFVKVFFFYSLLVLFWTTEIHLTLMFIGAKNITFLDSFIIVSLGSIAFAIQITPASLGIYEATYVAIFALLKLGTGLGITLVLMRRLIALMWAGIGVLGMMRLNPGGAKNVPGEDRDDPGVKKKIQEELERAQEELKKRSGGARENSGGDQESSGGA